MMLGFLLARSGVRVQVLEKHADFFRDFRGDTIHPSTLELMHELGLLDEFLKVPHEEVRELAGVVGGETVKMADFSHLPTKCKFLALMPQWDFLNFLAQQAKRYSGFELHTEAEAVDVILDRDRVRGVRVKTPAGVSDFAADLVIGADGRHSTIRERAGLAVRDMGAPMDVLWMRLSRKPGDPGHTLGYVVPGQILILITRSDYWQCGLVIRKGAFDEIRARGLPPFRDALAGIAPFLRDRLEEVDNWDQIKLLTVKVDRLPTWYRPGLLCIGDAAHAMSPIGGVGINVAIQDAVAAANILCDPLRAGTVSPDDLARVQRRRELPVRIIQTAQIAIQNRVIRRVLATDKPISLPWPLKLLQRHPAFRRIPARLIGLGFRPEHIRTT